MKKREFNKHMKSICTGKFLDIKKIPTLSDEIRSDMVYFIVRNRCPIVAELIPEGFDWSWLRCMAYMHKTTGKDYNWIHTSENRVK